MIMIIMIILIIIIIIIITMIIMIMINVDMNEKLLLKPEDWPGPLVNDMASHHLNISEIFYICQPPPKYFLNICQPPPKYLVF